MQSLLPTATALSRSNAIVAGFRVLRKLGEGARAEVYLASVDGALPVAIKLYRDQVPDADIGTELEALTRLDSEHVVRLLDVGRDGSGRPCLVLERCPHGTVTDLLTGGRRLAAGEAVTILAPLAETTAALHGAGVAHGTFSAGKVMFSGRGAPVLVGWGASQLFPSAAPPVLVDAQPAAAADRSGLRALARAVLEMTEPRPARILGWLDEAPDGSQFPGLLAEQLFALAEPVAVRLVETRAPSMGPPVVRVAGPSTPPTSLAGEEAAAEVVERAVPHWLAVLALPAFLTGQLSTWTGQATRVVARLRAVRRRFWVAAGVPIALLITLVMLLPPDDPRASGATGPATPTAPATAVNPPEIMGKDPLAAVAALVDARNRCLEELSLLCLDAVLQLGSPAHAMDTAMITAARDGGAPVAVEPLRYDQPTVMEQVGGSAIVSLGADSKPASLLMVRGEAGWRIRAYLDQVAVTGQYVTGQ